MPRTFSEILKLSAALVLLGNILGLFPQRWAVLVPCCVLLILTGVDSLRQYRTGGRRWLQFFGLAVILAAAGLLMAFLLQSIR